jgi:1-deoxy-D-xylulose-5-phosphate synthase
MHDVALQNLHVIFCLDRAGIAGADGPTHHGVFDIAYMRCLPNMVVASPMNESELRNMMFTAQASNVGPISIRYPRGEGVMPEWRTPFTAIKIGEGRQISEGNGIAILSLGHIGNHVVKAIASLQEEGIQPAHFDMRFAKPLDVALLTKIFTQYAKIITVEDGSLQGGFGSAILESASDQNYKGQIKRIGIPDRYIEHGEQAELHQECGMDAIGIAQTVKLLFQENEVLV